MHKRTILIDLDGVLNEYKGDFDKNIIPKIKNGAKEFIKKLSWLYIDDRCLTFEGDYKQLNEKIDNFKAWYK